MPNRVRKLLVMSAGLLLAQATLHELAAAHGIAGLASLPVPSWLFAWAATIVLVVSFIALSTLWSAPRLQEAPLRRMLRLPVWPVPLRGLIGLGPFAVVIYAGYAGVNSYTANFDPTFIYVIFWVGVPLASVLFGDFFSAFSPWRAAARASRGARSR